MLAFLKKKNPQIDELCEESTSWGQDRNINLRRHRPLHPLFHFHHLNHP
jgi:hypothetical protein